MYQDAGYGENWQPAANNARRLDPYRRSYVVLGTLFAIGFFLIIIVVLSLIPLYISHNSSTTSSNIQVSKIFINDYNLRFQSPFDNFDPQTILSVTENRQLLQAALTSMIQKDSTLSGSIIEINTPSTQSSRKRRQISNLRSITFGVNVIGGRACPTPTCANQFQSHATSCLSNLNQATPIVRYQQSNSSQIYWLDYDLPPTIQSNLTIVIVDSKLIATTLTALLQLDLTENQQPVQNSTSSLVG